MNNSIVIIVAIDVAIYIIVDVVIKRINILRIITLMMVIIAKIMVIVVVMMMMINRKVKKIMTILMDIPTPITHILTLIFTVIIVI